MFPESDPNTETPTQEELEAQLEQEEASSSLEEQNTDMDFLDETPKVDENKEKSAGTETQTESQPDATGTQNQEVSTPEATPAQQPATTTLPPEVLSEMQALRSQVTDLSQFIAQQREAQKELDEKQKKELELPDQEFIKTDDDLRDALESPQGFNKLLNQIYKAGAAKGRELAIAGIPEIAQKETTEILNRRSILSNFYNANSDLIPHHESIKVKAIELAKTGSYQTYEQLLEATEVAIRSEKGITKALQQKPTPGSNGAPAASKKPAIPAFAGGNGTPRKPSPAELTAAQKDVKDLLDF